MKKYYFFLFILLFSCKNSLPLPQFITTSDFSIFTNQIKEICRNESTLRIQKYLYTNFCFDFDDYRDKYNFYQIVSNFEFKLLLEYLESPIEIEKFNKITNAYAPTTDLQDKYKYVWYFENSRETQGWKITLVTIGD